MARPALFLFVSLIVAAVSIWSASHLEIRSSFQELLPEDFPSVREVKELIRRVGGDGTVLVVIEALEGPSGLPNAESVAPELASEFQALGPSVIRSVEFNLRPAEKWYEDHWPLFVGLPDLLKARDTLRDEIRKRKLAANPLAVDLDEDSPAPAAQRSRPGWTRSRSRRASWSGSASPATSTASSSIPITPR